MNHAVGPWGPLRWSSQWWHPAWPHHKPHSRATDGRAVERQSIAARVCLLPFMGTPLPSFSTSSFISASHQTLFHGYNFITSLIHVNRIRLLGTGFFHWKFIRSHCSLHRVLCSFLLLSGIPWCGHSSLLNYSFSEGQLGIKRMKRLA